MAVPYKDPLASVIEVSARGGKSLAVTLQDQTTGILNLPFLLPLSTPTLAVDTVINTSTVTLSPGHGLTTVNSAGHYIELASNSNGSHFLQATILSVTGDVVTFDCFMNHIFLISDTTVLVSDPDMHVDGSLTPVTFSVKPLPNQSGDITRIMFEIRDNSDMDFDSFGGIAELTKGLVLRVHNGDGTYRNLYNWKNNGDIIETTFDHAFAVNNGGGTRGFAARLTWAGQNKHGAAIRLDGALGESLDIVVQDDLTGLLRMHITAQGSELQGD